MEVSYKFKYIEDNLVKLVQVLLVNENFKKLVYYLVDDPLSQPNVTVDLIESGNVVLNLFDDGVLDEEKVTVFVNFMDGNFERYPLSSLIFTIDIVVPYSKWALNGLGKLRALSIFNEIAMDIDQKKVMGMTDAVVTRSKTSKVNNKYSAMTLGIKVNSSSMKGLR
ncbi:MAG TPA: hypothetical protein VFD03_10175 [Clostridia bacterium]|nr:hypothetical protein [Clostridia bacterium]